jgi:predicted porin
MKNQIKLAVAGAVFAAASSANAGIVIPAGDWTLDVNGNVNAFANFSQHDNEGTITGSLMDAYGTGDPSNTGSDGSTQGINTGLLPAWLGFTGTTRQNDVDVSFTISMQPNVSDNGATGDSKAPLFRQAFLTFGDKSWGTVKMGKDIGIFGKNAILSDMTLLGVGGGFRNSGVSTTTGGIGSGYIYAAWKGQFAYTTPNMNGFQATVAMVNPNMIDRNSLNGSTKDQTSFGFEAEASYEWSGDIAGKAWVSTAQYNGVKDDQYNNNGNDFDVQMWDVGVNLNSGNLGLTAYYYDGDAGGNGVLGYFGADSLGKERDSQGGYLQATYVIPTGTKLGLAYGETSIDQTSTDRTAGTVLADKTSRWTLGAYHPLTKHLNLVAEYNDIEIDAHNSSIENDAQAISLGAILFF